MGNPLVTFALMGSYAVCLLFVWTVFEKRLNVVYRRHVEKCAPFGERGLGRLDKRQRIALRTVMLANMAVSLGVIYFMTN